MNNKERLWGKQRKKTKQNKTKTKKKQLKELLQ